MTDQGLSEDVEKFIAEHINSLEQLEVLLLLHRRPEKEWTADEVSQELRLLRQPCAWPICRREDY